MGSLLALKECFRALSSSSSSLSPSNYKGRRPPFRDSKLTRILEDSLAPSRNKETVSVMLVNVCPASKLKSGTVNALRYGQMYGSSKRRQQDDTKASSLSGTSGSNKNNNNKAQRRQ